jgi:hypothetical protein
VTSVDPPRPPRAPLDGRPGGAGAADGAERAVRAVVRTTSPVFRLAASAFLLGILAFYGLAQLKVVTAVGGGDRIPGLADILHRYHGDPSRSRLRLSLDPSRSESDTKRMYGFLGDDEPSRAANHAKVLAWLDGGATEAGWTDVAPILAGEARCGACHSAKDGGSRSKGDLPFDRREDVLPLTVGSPPIALAELATTSHNHLFSFLVASLLVSLLFGLTRWRGPVVPILVLGAFGGALVDVAAWWATRAWGPPFHVLVFAGGATFGLAICAMTVATLDELLLKGRLGGLLERPLAALRLGRRERP